MGNIFFPKPPLFRFRLDIGNIYVQVSPVLTEDDVLPSFFPGFFSRPAFLFMQIKGETLRVTGEKCRDRKTAFEDLGPEPEWDWCWGDGPSLNFETIFLAIKFGGVRGISRICFGWLSIIFILENLWPCFVLDRKCLPKVFMVERGRKYSWPVCCFVFFVDTNRKRSKARKEE